ncbi:MAG TPA: hypothetical protein V6C65_40695 [Allocoleopsis sp.]
MRVVKILEFGLVGMTVYVAGATLTFSLLLNAFLKDHSTSKTDTASWLVLGIATLFWFIALPCILRQRMIQSRTLAQTSTSHLTSLG